MLGAARLSARRGVDIRALATLTAFVAALSPMRNRLQATKTARIQMFRLGEEKAYNRRLMSIWPKPVNLKER
jgi:hypothetical protein